MKKILFYVLTLLTLNTCLATTEISISLLYNGTKKNIKYIHDQNKPFSFSHQDLTCKIDMMLKGEVVIFDGEVLKGSTLFCKPVLVTVKDKPARIVMQELQGKERKVLDYFSIALSAKDLN